MLGGGLRMRDEEDSFDNCDSWTEASFIRRFAQLPQAREFPREQMRSEFSPSRVFELATHGRVADLHRAIAHPGVRDGGETLTLAMPELFSTIACLEESWKAQKISFGEAIRGLFTIREVIQNIETGRTVDASAMHFSAAVSWVLRMAKCTTLARRSQRKSST